MMQVASTTASAERFQAGLSRLRAGPVGRVLSSSWLWGLAVGVASWPAVTISPSGGLDPSWHLGLQMAVGSGLDFGTDVAFTYGPLGMLDYPLVTDPDLAALSLLFYAVLVFGAGLTFVYLARRSFPLVVAVPVALLVVHLAPRVAAPVAIAWCVAAVAEDAPAVLRRLLPFAGGIVSAVFVLEKQNIGYLVLAVCATAVVFMEEGRRVRNAASFAATFLVSFGLLWVALRQDVSAIPDYVATSAAFVSGYSSAMVADAAPDDTGPHLLVGLGAIGAGVAAAVLGGRGMAPTRRVGLVLAAAIALFALWKTTFVRHELVRDGYVLTGALAVILAFRWRAEQRLYALAAVISIITLTFVMTERRFATAVDPVTASERMVGSVRAVFEPERREETLTEARARVRSSYAVDAKTLRHLEGRSVHVHPWDAALIWAYDLEWEPLPIFQSYSAYAPALDDRNARHVASPAGPERILVAGRIEGADAPPELGGATLDQLQLGNAVGLDGRFLPYDQPATTVAMLCNFEPLRTTRSYQVLGRVPDRCGEPRRLESVTAADGEAVAVPRPGRREIVLARVHGLEPSGLERLRTLAYRSTERHVSFDSDRLYRVVPRLASQELIMRTARGVDFPKPFALSPDARRVSFSQEPGFLSSTGELEIEFLAIPSKPRDPGPRPATRPGSA